MSRLSCVERYHKPLAKRARNLRLLSSRRVYSLPQMPLNPYTPTRIASTRLYLYLHQYHDAIHMPLLTKHRRVFVSLPPSILRSHPYIPTLIASARRRIFTPINTTMSRVKVTTRYIQWWSTVYGKGLNIHDRSKSGSLIDMAKWSVGPSGRWEDDNTGYMQVKSRCIWLEVSDRKDTDGIWSIHLSGTFGEEGRFQLAEIHHRGHLEYSLARSLWQGFHVCFFIWKAEAWLG